MVDSAIMVEEERINGWKPSRLPTEEVTALIKSKEGLVDLSLGIHAIATIANEETGMSGLLILVDEGMPEDLKKVLKSAFPEIQASVEEV